MSKFRIFINVSYDVVSEALHRHYNVRLIYKLENSTV